MESATIPVDNRGIGRSTERGQPWKCQLKQIMAWKLIIHQMNFFYFGLARSLAPMSSVCCDWCVTGMCVTGVCLYVTGVAKAQARLSMLSHNTTVLFVYSPTPLKLSQFRSVTQEKKALLSCRHVFSLHSSVQQVDLLFQCALQVFAQRQQRGG